jgi:hypothetical protein
MKNTIAGKEFMNLVPAVFGVVSIMPINIVIFVFNP